MINKSIIIILIFFSILFNCYSQCQFTQVKQVGNHSTILTNLSFDSRNNIYVSGQFSDSTQIDTFKLKTRINFYEPFIAKLDKNFDVSWVGNPPGPRTAYGMSVDKKDNVYITGYIGDIGIFGKDTVRSYGDFDIYFAKYSNQGTCIWGRNAGSDSSDVGQSISADDNCNVYITGQFRKTATFGKYQITSQGKSDVYIAKYDSAGNSLWVRSAGGSLNDCGLGIAVDKSGNIYVTGYYEGNAFFGIDTIISTSNLSNTFIAKYDSEGNYIWSKHPTGFTAGIGRAITTDAFNNVYVAGQFEGEATFGTYNLITRGVQDIFLLKIDSSGNVLWAKSGGGKVQDRGKSVFVDKTGNVYLTGIVNLPGYGMIFFDNDSLLANESDIIIAKYDKDGKLICIKTAGGYSGDSGEGIIADRSGNVYIAGNISGTVLFDSLTLNVDRYGVGFLAVMKMESTSHVSESPLSLHSLSIYPNPGNGLFNLKYNALPSSDCLVMIFDVLGRVVYKNTYSSYYPMQNETTVNLQSYPRGFYIANIFSGKHVFMKKFIIQ